MLTDDQVRTVLTRSCRLMGGKRAWSKHHGFAPQVAVQVLSGSMNVTDRVARALGYKRVHGWEKDDGL